MARSPSPTVGHSQSDGKVRFTWKDYRGNVKIKVTMLAADEFIRRFLLHTLPGGFHRIRHYGFLANGSRSDNLARCRRLLDARGWSAFGGADHGSAGRRIGKTSLGLGFAQAFSGQVGAQVAATNVSALRVGIDRSRRSQEHCANGEAARARRKRSIAPLHCCRGLGRSACGDRAACYLEHKGPPLILGRRCDWDGHCQVLRRAVKLRRRLGANRGAQSAEQAGSASTTSYGGGPEFRLGGTDLDPPDDLLPH